MNNLQLTHNTFFRKSSFLSEMPNMLERHNHSLCAVSNNVDNRSCIFQAEIQRCHCHRFLACHIGWELNVSGYLTLNFEQFGNHFSSVSTPSFRSSTPRLGLHTVLIANLLAIIFHKFPKRSLSKVPPSGNAMTRLRLRIDELWIVHAYRLHDWFFLNRDGHVD